MAAEYATFEVARATRAGAVLAGGGYQAHREFLDFIVDGRSLLLRLDEPDGRDVRDARDARDVVDAVSPLAADLGPSLFTSQVRGLLLERESGLGGGRRIVYGCPECEGLDCGVVTAVIERRGAAVIWRDFAWQTGDRPVTERDRYPRAGPFRFRAEQYDGVLERLLLDTPALVRQVLLVGRRVALFVRLAAALRSIGIGTDLTGDVAATAREELRRYGAVVIDPAAGERERAAVRAAFAAANADTVFVEAPAPLVPPLVAQLEQALQQTPRAQRRLVTLTTVDGWARLEVRGACRVRLTGYWRDALRRERVHCLFEGRLAPGVHRLPLDGLGGGGYVVARAFGDVLVAGVPGRTGPARRLRTDRSARR
ncbi:oxidoreductase [Streptomyces sp. NPDC052396]|uniref:oxidoreductase n=1 Tax=Streptomyces sp. NPDC052396 TaxID=3365689 RepID=UPI0037D75BB2